MSLIDTPAAYTREMKLKAIEREIGYRKRVYARRVAESKMTQKQADYEIGVFEAIAKDMREPALTDRQVELIRRGIVALMESTDEDDVKRAELHGINDALRDIQQAVAKRGGKP